MKRQDDDDLGYEGLLSAALDRMLDDPGEAERVVRRLAQAHRLLVLGQLAATVVHDLNNHLAVIVSCASHLEERRGRAPDEDAVADILASARRGVAMCHQILDLARSGRRQDERFDVNALLARMAPFLRKLAAGSGGGRIEVDVLPSPEPAWTMGDEALFSNAIVNVAMNAREAMPGGGRLAIRAGVVEETAGEERPRRRVRVDVVDTGSGIPADVLSRVFEPFFSTKPEGTGLGLASVRRAVERHRGKVAISSKLGEGTTVTILVPLAEGAAP
jgi:two-component system cell cycle sensor histidine kinase/response regulator CckA